MANMIPLAPCSRISVLTFPVAQKLQHTPGGAGSLSFLGPLAFALALFFWCAVAGKWPQQPALPSQLRAQLCLSHSAVSAAT